MPINTDPLAATHPGSDEAVAIAAFAQAAKDGVEAGVSTNASASITINAASFGDRQFIKILCTFEGTVTVTFADDAPAGKAVEFVAYGAATVMSGTPQVSGGASIVKPSSAVHSTTERYAATIYEVDSNSGSNAAWRLVARP